jgi:hypothetical protein
MVGIQNAKTAETAKPRETRETQDHKILQQIPFKNI